MNDAIYEGIKNIPYIGSTLLLIIEVISSIILASIIGYERERKGHGAGLRTHIMVSIGACLIMQSSISAPALNQFVNRDPARIAAQVVSGIGFLGAGTIIQNRTNIRGLTTAATIWLCGGIGLACGSGYFLAALICSITATLTLIFLSRLERRISRKSPKIIMTIESDLRNFKEIIDIADNNEIIVKDINSFKIGNKSDKYRVTITILPNSSNQIAKFSEELQTFIKPDDFRLLRK